MVTRTSTSREFPRSQNATDLPPSHSPGDQLAGRYRLVRLLGEGGLGRVWLAEDGPGRDRVALKILAPDAAAFAESLQEEFSKLTRLVHPNIVRVHDFGLAEGDVPYFTMDWIDGRPLNDAIPSAAVDVALPLLEGACAGLDAIHAAGFVHGDVKPSNLLVLGGAVESREQLQIVDLSLAGQSGDPRRSRGTPGFAAPEVVAGEPPSVLSDLYGLGASFYTALSGRAPFLGRSLEEVLRAQSKEEASAVPLRAAGTPEELVRTLLRLLARDPRQRPRAATEIWSEISSLARRKGKRPASRALAVPSRGSWIGRTKEIAAAEGQVAKGGLPALVTGPSGIGRSRFLRELAVRAELAGGQALVVSCAGRADAAREWMRRTASLSGSENAGTWAEAIAGFRGRGPTVLVLEDLHLAGEADLEIARQVLVSRAPKETGVFLSWEDSPVHSGTAFDEFALLARSAWIEDSPQAIELGPLTHSESDQLVRSMLAGQKFSKVEDAVWKQSAGNPAWIEGSILALVERGALSKESDGWRLATDIDLSTPLPALERIHSFRLSGLSSDARRWLAALACLGGEAPIDVVSTVAQVSDSAEREVLAAGLALAETRDGIAWTSAQPPSVGELARRGQPRDEYRAVCARGAEASTGNPLVAAELWLAADRPEQAANCLAAGSSSTHSPTEKWAMAKTYLLARERLGALEPKDLETAAHAAEQAFRMEEAAVLWDRFATTTARAGSDVLSAARGKLKAAECLRWLGRHDDALGRLSESETLLHGLPGSDSKYSISSRIESERSWVAFTRGKMEEAEQMALHAMRVAPATDLEAQFTSWNRLAAIYPRSGNLEKAEEAIREAFDLASQMGDEVAAARIHANAAILARMRGEAEKELLHLQANLSIMEKHGQWNFAAIGRSNLIVYLVRHAKVTEIREALRRAEEAVRANGALDMLYTVLSEAARLELRLGSLTACHRLSLAVLRLAKSTNKKTFAAWSWNRIGLVHMLRGDRRKALACYRKALSIWRTGILKEGTGYTLANLGEIALDRSQFSRADRLLSEAAIQARGFPATSAWVVRPRALAAARMGDGAAARRALAEGPSIQDVRGDPASEGSVLEAQAAVALLEGRLNDALELYERADALYLQWEYPLARARCLATSGALLAGLASRPARATAIALTRLRSAQTFFERTGADGPLLAIASPMSELAGISGPPDILALDEVPSALYEVSQLINSILDFPELLQRALSIVARRLGAERGLIVLTDSKTGEFEPVGRFGDFDADGHADALQISTSILRRVAQSGFALHSDDAVLDPQLRGVKSVYDLSLRSVLCVALRLRDQVIGAIYLQNRSAPGAFSDRDIAFLESFSNSIAIAIENSRLHDSLRQANDLLVDENVSLRREVKEFFRYDNLIGRSAQMSEVQGLIDRFAQVDNDILILGETGTGKEVVAKTIHYNSSRKSKPFLSMNCVAFPETLIEAELFGIEDHVATGVRGRAGLFERAEGGTVLLDEIGDMALDVQAKLLRVLQEREFTRVGGKRAMKMNVRVFAATFRDLRQFVREERFRADLYYRVNRLVIHLPPLRDRKGDIPLLARYFVESLSRRAERPVPKISPRLLAVLTKCPWKGNVRELEHYMERLLVMTDGPTLEPNVLPPDLEESDAQRPTLASLDGHGPGTLGEALQDYEREMVRLALQRSGGNKTQSAKLLGIPEPTLRYRIRKLGIQ